MGKLAWPQLWAATAVALPVAAVQHCAMVSWSHSSSREAVEGSAEDGGLGPGGPRRTDTIFHLPSSGTADLTGGVRPHYKGCLTAQYIDAAYTSRSMIVNGIGTTLAVHVVHGPDSSAGTTYGFGFGFFSPGSLHAVLFRAQHN